MREREEEEEAAATATAELVVDVGDGVEVEVEEEELRRRSRRRSNQIECSQRDSSSGMAFRASSNWRRAPETDGMAADVVVVTVEEESFDSSKSARRSRKSAYSIRIIVSVGFFVIPSTKASVADGNGGMEEKVRGGNRWKKKTRKKDKPPVVSCA